MDAEKIIKEVIVEKEVIKEVIVEKEVIQEVPVEVIVEKEVIKEVTAVDDRIYECVHCDEFKGKFDEVADHEVECKLKAIQKLNAQLSARDVQLSARVDQIHDLEDQLEQLQKVIAQVIGAKKKQSKMFQWREPIEIYNRTRNNHSDSQTVYYTIKQISCNPVVRADCLIQ